MWEVDDEHVLRYRCHTGHAFNADALESGQSSAVENALFAALAVLEEKAQLSRVLAARFRSRDSETLAMRYDEQVAQADENARAIRAILS